MPRTIENKIIGLCQISKQKITCKYLFIVYYTSGPWEKNMKADYQNNLRSIIPHFITSYLDRYIDA